MPIPSRIFLPVAAIPCAVLVLTSGCVHYVAKPIAAEKNLTQLEGRSLADAGLLDYVKRHNWHDTVEWNLDTLTLAAIYFNPDLEAARARWALAKAGKVTAAQRPNPIVGVSPTYNSTTTIPTPWIVGATLDVPLETAGKRRKRMDQAEQLSEAARLAVATVAWDVRARLRRALLEHWAAQTAETLIARQFEAQKDLVKLIEGQRDAGAVTLVEVTRERILLQQKQMALLDAKNRQRVALVQLAATLGLPSSALAGIRISHAQFLSPPAELPAAEARRHALLNRADVLAGLAEYAASESALRLQIARQYPDVHLNPGYAYDQADNKWTLGLSFELPILNQNRGPIAQAEAQRAELAARFNALQARVLGEIETAVAGYETAREKLKVSSTVMEQLIQQERLADALYQSGEGSRLGVVSANVERLTAALVEMDTRIKAQEALGLLENALQLPTGFTTDNVLDKP